MTNARMVGMIVLVGLAGGACDDASPPGPADDGGEGAGGSGSPCPSDPCENHATHEACCADPACGWHQDTGHVLHGIAPCVSHERVCVVAEQEVRACAATMTCVVQGVGQDTENDCTLPPGGSVSLLGRGICACEEE
jgi:hypothetical protein